MFMVTAKKEGKDMRDFEFGNIKNQQKELILKGVFRKRNLSLKNSQNFKTP